MLSLLASHRTHCVFITLALHAPISCHSPFSFAHLLTPFPFAMPAIVPTTGLAPYTIGASTYETYYKVFGDLSSDKRPLVVAHGGPSLSHDYLLPVSDIAATHDVSIVFYDQVGTGLSTHIPEKKGDTSFWTIDLFID